MAFAFLFVLFLLSCLWRVAPSCELPQSVSSWQINQRRGWQGQDDIHCCQNKSLLGQSGAKERQHLFFLKVSLNESSAGNRGIFKTCQHDWLSLPFCTLSPNHRVAVAKKPLITNCWLLPVAEKKRLLIARLPHSFPNNVFCKKCSAEECFWKCFESESVA